MEQDELVKTERAATLELLQKAEMEDLGVEIFDGVERTAQEKVFGFAFTTKTSR